MMAAAVENPLEVAGGVPGVVVQSAADTAARVTVGEKTEGEQRPRRPF